MSYLPDDGGPSLPITAVKPYQRMKMGQDNAPAPPKTPMSAPSNGMLDLPSMFQPFSLGGGFSPMATPMQHSGNPSEMLMQYLNTQHDQFLRQLFARWMSGLGY